MKTAGKKKSKNIVLRVAFVLLTLYIVVSLINLQVQIGQKKKELALLKNQYEEQLLENEDLERLLNANDDAEYIEQVAREKLGLVKPNERIFVNGSGN